MVPSLAVALSLLAVTIESGSQLTYRGSLEPVKVERPNVGKSFELTLVIGDEGTVQWLLSDSGREPIAWHERWAALKWSQEARSLEGTMPSFQYEHGTGNTRVTIVPPLSTFSREIKGGDTWSDGKIEYEVSEGESFEGRATWDVTAKTLVGRRRTLTIDREDHRVYALREKVFVGQGEEQLLKYELVSQAKLSSEELSNTQAAISAWNDARESWLAATEDRTPQNVKAANKDLSAKLPELKKASEGTMLAKLSEVVADQLKSENDLKAAVAAMRTKAIEKPLPRFEMKDANGKAWSHQSFAGKVVVLHFWTYRDENLREPYGQVGYLDYLSRRQDNAKVQVLGVAIADEEEQRANLRPGVRRFRDFMNVSYPILLDDGQLLAKLGDPRKAGEALPLFVVIDAKGNVMEYKAGLYEVKRDEGLAELEAAIKKAAVAK